VHAGDPVEKMIEASNVKMIEASNEKMIEASNEKMIEAPNLSQKVSG